MRRAMLIICLAAAAWYAHAVTPPAAQPPAGLAPAAPPAGGPPPPPPYQMRAQLPAGDRLAAGKDGAAVFSNRCGACHLAGGMGTNMLTKLRMMAGQPPESALLSNRTDLTRTYVKTVVRHGYLAMPKLTRVEVTDAELDSIAAYLGKGGA